MITMNEAPVLMSKGKYQFTFIGLSTDDKPVSSYKGKWIANGSTFLEIDTKKLSMYDEDSNTWV